MTGIKAQTSINHVRGISTECSQLSGCCCLIQPGSWEGGKDINTWSSPSSPSSTVMRGSGELWCLAVVGVGGGGGQSNVWTLKTREGNGYSHSNLSVYFRLLSDCVCSLWGLRLPFSSITSVLIKTAELSISIDYVSDKVDNVLFNNIFLILPCLTCPGWYWISNKIWSFNVLQCNK